ncbi:LysM peptidoglycan-binding domain-containing protein [bacterium]|nr:LysM peptidoglycan-binding domain-containing protein [bacterium]
MKKLLIGLVIMIMMVSLYAEAKKGGGYYIVPQKGDSLWKIANSNYGVATKTIYKAIQAANEDKIKSINYLKPGVKIYLPTKEEINKYSLLVLAKSEKTVVTKKIYSSPKVYTPRISVSGVRKIIKPRKKVSK